MATKARDTRVLWAGRLQYGLALRMQKVMAENHLKRQGKIVNSLMLVEHEPVYTVGIRDKIYDKNSEMKLRKLGAEYYRTNRGGLITYHGPGQLVVYPIIDLRLFDTTVRRYVAQIEELVIRLCAEFGIKAGRSSDTGVWVDNCKICAIGIHASRYITTHGLALNCNTDLKWFDHIVPCGIEGKGVTSISQQLGMQVTTEDVIPLFKNAFQDQFQCTLVNFPPDEAADLLRTSNEIAKANTS